MNLDDGQRIKQLDPQNMLAEIDGLPDQLEKAWALGMSQKLDGFTGVRRLLIAGMGGSAIGGDIVSTYVAERIETPVFVHRNYGLPAWARGPETLVIASSHSGNTEETLSTFDEALDADCRLMVITTGGQLAERAAAAGVPIWRFDHAGQPRAAVGFSFGLLLAALVKTGLMPDVSEEVEGAVEAMRHQQMQLRTDVPAVQNPAKRYAGQLVDRYVAVFGSDYLTPVARRWKTQINELAKGWAQFEFLPEADHNTLAGVVNPEELLTKIVAIFLQAPSDHPRNTLRAELTRAAFMQEGIATDMYRAKGARPLDHIWTALHFGDYLAYYLAIAYGVDPTPVDALEGLKMALRR